MQSQFTRELNLRRNKRIMSKQSQTLTGSSSLIQASIMQLMARPLVKTLSVATMMPLRLTTKLLPMTPKLMQQLFSPENLIIAAIQASTHLNAFRQSAKKKQRQIRCVKKSQTHHHTVKPCYLDKSSIRVVMSSEIASQTALIV